MSHTDEVFKIQQEILDAKLTFNQIAYLHGITIADVETICEELMGQFAEDDF